MVNTGLNQLSNLPDCKLEKVSVTITTLILFLLQIYLSDNQLNGEEIQKLAKYKDTLTSLRLAQNVIKRPEDVQALLAACPKLQKLDLTGNPVCDNDDKSNNLIDKYLTGESELIALNCQDQDGNIVDDSYSEFDEEGEEEDDEEGDEISLDEGLRQRMQDG